MRLVWAEVVAVFSEEPGLQRLVVASAVDDLAGAPAICYPQLTGACAPGERVLLNTTAVDLGLGTGGNHFVVAREGTGLDAPARGHVMKARYTPLQVDVLAAEEPASPHHAVLAAVDDVGGMPVVCCALHSQLVAVAAALRAGAPGARVAFVMSDAASLPLALSDLVRECRSAGLVDTTVSCGQAFGGELEAVTLHSGLLVARHAAGADVAIVANGPGVTGTGTPYGHGGVAQGEAVNAAAAVGGRPVAALRVSFADPRDRHRGVSHHSIRALAHVAFAPALVAMPRLPAVEGGIVERALEEGGVWRRHERADAAVSPDTLPDARGVAMLTMGRSVADDPAFFAAAAAAGEVAAGLLSV